MNKMLVKHTIRKKPDILLILKGETILGDSLRAIRRKTDTLIINIFPDNPILMGRFDAIEPCHYYFIKDTYIFELLRKIGLKNIYYLPQCTDPEVYEPMCLNEKDLDIFSNDVSLIGSMYPYRLKFIQEILDLKPAIWGKGWLKSSDQKIIELCRGKDIRGTQKAKAISGSAISLNPHHPLNDIHGVNRRTYDIAACRGFQLADYKVDMEKMFKLNDEIICFKTIEELKKNVEYYLKHPDERTQIAEAARQRVMREHTYDHRAKEILEIIASNN